MFTMGREYIPMTGSARSALIAISVLWFLFAVVVFFRLFGRIRGIGIGADDIFALCALVSHQALDIHLRRLSLTIVASFG